MSVKEKATEENQSIYLGKTIVREGSGENFALLTKSTITQENAMLLVEALTAIISASQDTEEKIHLTAFLKNSQYDETSYFGNLKVEVVQQVTSASKAKKSYTPKKSGVSSDAKDRIAKLGLGK